MDISKEFSKLKLIEKECEKIADQDWEDRDHEDFASSILAIVSPELFDKHFRLD